MVKRQINGKKLAYLALANRREGCNLNRSYVACSLCQLLCSLRRAFSVVVHPHDNRVRRLQIQTETTSSGRQEENLVGRIRVVECGQQFLSNFCLGVTVKPTKFDVAIVKKIFHDIHHSRPLKEDQHLTTAIRVSVPVRDRSRTNLLCGWF